MEREPKHAPNLDPEIGGALAVVGEEYRRLEPQNCDCAMDTMIARIDAWLVALAFVLGMLAGWYGGC